MKSDWLKKLSESLEYSMPKGSNIARTLADDLCISAESAYRRLNGKTEFLPKELLLLREKYGVSLDALAGDGHTISMRLSPLFKTDSNLNDYLGNLLNELRFLISEGNIHMHCLAADIPFFRLMGQKNLAAFKLFYWQKSILGIKEFQERRFNEDSIDAETLETCILLDHSYNSVCSTEIWNEQTINGTLRQMEYYEDCSFFESSEVLFLVYKDLIQLVQNVAAEARSGLKQSNKNSEDPVSYSLWNCELIIDNNSVLLVNESSQKHVLAVGFNSFNSFRTLHPFIISEYKAWLDAMVSKSTMLSGQSDRYRIEFIRKIMDKIYQSAHERLPGELNERLLQEDGLLTA